MPFRLIGLIGFLFFLFLSSFFSFPSLSLFSLFPSPSPSPSSGFTRQREGTIVVRGTTRCSVIPIFSVAIFPAFFSFFRFPRHERGERGRGANASWFQIKLHGIIAGGAPYHWYPVPAVASVPVAGIAAKPVEEVRNVGKAARAFR